MGWSRGGSGAENSDVAGWRDDPGGFWNDLVAKYSEGKVRCAAVSGGTGGGDTLSIPSEVPVDNDGAASTTTVVSGPQSDLPILLSYYEVVWVIRVK